MMIIALVIVALFLTAIVCFVLAFDSSDELGEIGATMLLFGLAMLISSAVGSLFSLGSAINLDATYNGVIAEYGHAIDRYTESAVVIKIEEQTFTDFRYSGYQESVAGLIKDLRNQTSKYNRDLLKKRAYNRNPVFSWFTILPPDSLRLISLVDY